MNKAAQINDASRGCVQDRVVDAYGDYDRDLQKRGHRLRGKVNKMSDRLHRRIDRLVVDHAWSRVMHEMAVRRLKELRQEPSNG